MILSSRRGGGSLAARLRLRAKQAAGQAEENRAKAEPIGDTHVGGLRCSRTHRWGHDRSGRRCFVQPATIVT